MPTTESTPAADDSARKLLEIVAGLAADLKPGAAAARRVELDSALDRDLGFDSLTRVELVLRIERGFGVHLPEHLLGAAESPRDLLRAETTGIAVGPERLDVFLGQRFGLPLPLVLGEQRKGGSADPVGVERGVLYATGGADVGPDVFHGIRLVGDGAAIIHGGTADGRPADGRPTDGSPTLRRESHRD